MNDEPQVFRLHDNPQIKHIGPFNPLVTYLKAYRASLNSSVTDETFAHMQLFPQIYLDKEGVGLQPANAVSITKILNSLCVVTGTVSNIGAHGYSSHCLRRGGAQYHLHLAPYPFRMNLNKLKKHGGWSKQESYDTLMKYIIDEWDALDTDVVDFWNPDKVIEQYSLQYGGDGLDFEGGNEETTQVLLSHVATLTHKVERLETSINEKNDQILALLRAVLAANVPVAGPDAPDVPEVPKVPKARVTSPGMIDGVLLPTLNTWQICRDLWDTGHQVADDKTDGKTRTVIFPLNDLPNDQEMLFGKQIFFKIRKVVTERAFYNCDAEFEAEFAHAPVSDLNALLIAITAKKRSREALGAAKTRKMRKTPNAKGNTKAPRTPSNAKIIKKTSKNGKNGKVNKTAPRNK